MSIEFNKVTWYSKWSAVVLFIIIIPILTFYIGREYQKTVYIVENNSTYVADTEEVGESLTTQSKFSDPMNATYIIDGQEISLVDGASESDGAETKIFGQPVEGDINNDGQADSTFFLYQDTSGTGTFFFVVASIKTGEGYESLPAFFIGDRIAPQNIRINNGVIEANYATRRENEPMTASPSVGVTKYLVYKNGELKEREEIKDIFESSPRPNNVSNVVGYFASGAFVFNNVPDWIVEHWGDKGDKTDNVFAFSPREEIPGRDFSDIVIEVSTTTEQFNASYLYETQSKSIKDLMIAEIFLNSVGDTRIHHIQRRLAGGIEDIFYIDGNGKTATVTFQAQLENYAKYGTKIREFVQGIGKGEAPRG